MNLTHTALRPGRLSSFLKGEMAMSTGLVNRLKMSGGLLVNGEPRRTNFQVAPGDTICALLDDPAPEYPPEDMPLSILFEDEHILVLDKPAGMLIHPSPHRMTGTLANGVLGHYARTGQACAFHPVTRLDRDTFGIVLLAKNAHVHAKFNDLHAAGLLHKTYHGLVYGSMPQADGLIDAPIARLPKPSLLRRVEDGGQESRTRYRVYDSSTQWSLVELHPLTGRTHQLRVHCAHLGCPILGDPQYGSEQSLALSAQLGIETQQLCAHSLQFIHPMTGAEMTLKSGLDVICPPERMNAYA